MLLRPWIKISRLLHQLYKGTSLEVFQVHLLDTIFTQSDFMLTIESHLNLVGWSPIQGILPVDSQVRLLDVDDRFVFENRKYVRDLQLERMQVFLVNSAQLHLQQRLDLKLTLDLV